MVVRALIL